jgi:hypothetical protein
VAEIFFRGMDRCRWLPERREMYKKYLFFILKMHFDAWKKNFSALNFI